MDCLKWFSKWWYQYLFESKSSYHYEMPDWDTIKCRIKGHPCGMIFYNPGGLEPDYHCKNCGDEL